MEKPGSDILLLATHMNVSRGKCVIDDHIVIVSKEYGKPGVCLVNMYGNYFFTKTI